MKRAQFDFVWIFDVAREIELVDQNCFAILDRKSFGNESRNFQLILNCANKNFLIKLSWEEA
jgi:hypothetical protein